MTRRRRAITAALGTVAVLAGGGIVLASGSGDDGSADAGGPPAAAPATAGGTVAAAPRAPRRPVPTTADAREGRWAAQLTRAAVLRDAPGGRRVARVGRRTGFGGPRILAVAAVRPGWVAVRTEQRRDRRPAWLPEDAVRLAPVRTTLVADLSDRELTLRRDGRVRSRMPIGIGRPGSVTPVGRYGVTDRLRTESPRLRGAYGCCVLALSGHQSSPPKGWQGGTRLALHGTPDVGSVGREASGGCLRLREGDIRALLEKVPLGATLIVRA